MRGLDQFAAYEERALKTAPTERPRLRLDGLRRLLKWSRGATVLDIGTHTGVVAREFARAGAKAIDGVDIWPRSVWYASAAVRKYPAVRTRFRVCDLTGGMEALKDALHPMPWRYDVVLYLGVHHHLQQQMAPEALEAFVTGLAGMAGRYIAVRAPLPARNAVTDIIWKVPGFSICMVHDTMPDEIDGLIVFRHERVHVSPSPRDWTDEG